MLTMQAFTQLSYHILSFYPDHYYMVDASDKNNYRFVTARGWEDLSEMMQLYEESGILVDHALAAQYVQNPEFSKGFAEYYDRFNYYREKYDVDAILEGGITAQNIADARAAGTEEAVALMNLLMDGITYTMRSCIQNGEDDKTYPPKNGRYPCEDKQWSFMPSDNQ